MVVSLNSRLESNKKKRSAMRKRRPDHQAEKLALSGANLGALDPDHRLDDGRGHVLADCRRAARLREPGHLFRERIY